MRVWCLIGGLWLAACAHGPQRIETRVQDPKADLSEALALFRRGDFNRALIGFRRVQFELAPTQPEVAEARYFIAECDFQLGDRATAALDGEDESRLWELADLVARVRRADPEQLELVAELLSVLARHAEKSSRRGRRGA